MIKLRCQGNRLFLRLQVHRTEGRVWSIFQSAPAVGLELHQLRILTGPRLSRATVGGCDLNA